MSFFKNLLRITSVLLVANLISINGSQAAIKLKIDNSEFNPQSKILFFGFNSPDPKLNQDITEIANMIKKNLDSTNLFISKISQENMEVILLDDTIYKNINDDILERNIDSQSVPNFKQYQEDEVSAIIIGDFGYDKEGNIEVKVRGWDVLDEKQLFGRYYVASSDNYNKIANYISDEIYIKLTGEKAGHFNSKIAYIAESGSFKNRKKRLAIINFDGTRQKFLSDGQDLVLTPTFSKDKSEVFYLLYFLDTPHIFKTDLRTGRTKKATGFRSTNFAPAIHPFDSNKIVLSATVDKNTDIYEYDLEKNLSYRITNDEAIDTTPHYSPDGSKIAFTSDRDGRQQIYVFDFVNYSLKKITSNYASYSKPRWSPDGKYIAFTKISNGEFHAGIMSPDGANEKLLAKGYLLEGVKWSPNSRYLIYSKKRTSYGKGSIPRLYIVDIVTSFEYEIPTPKNEGAIDPDWIL